MDQAFVRSLLTDSVLVPPQQLGGNFRAVVLSKLRAAHEGLCTRHGYIMPGSISLHTVAPGRVQAAMLNGSVRFDVHFYASVCDPDRGAVLPARVVNANRFGVLAHAGILAADGHFTPVVEIIIAKQMDGLDLPTTVAQDALVDADALDALKAGDEVVVQVLGKRAQLRASCISVIGVVLKAAPSSVDMMFEANPDAPGVLPPLRGGVQSEPPLAGSDTDDGSVIDADEDDDDDDDGDELKALKKTDRPGAGADGNGAFDADSDDGLSDTDDVGVGAVDTGVDVDDDEDDPGRGHKGGGVTVEEEVDDDDADVSIMDDKGDDLDDVDGEFSD